MGSFGENDITEAYLYLRVSSQRQVDEGHGLEGQERRCQAYADYHKYNVVEVFKDEAVSGGVIDRPDMQRLLAVLDKRKSTKEAIVIIDDIKRFARDVEGHFQLKTAIYSRNARLESPSHRFEDSPEGKYVETILAAGAELERNQNKRQVNHRMKARLEAGFWCFYAPVGYKNTKDEVYGKIVEPVEPKASIIREALEGFASRRLPEQVDMQRFFQERNYYGDPSKKVHLEFVKRILKQTLFYAGYIEYKDWDVTRRKGHHKTIISLETHEKIQARLSGEVKSFSRKTMHPDFPLRPFVLCAGCSKPLTASWNTGNGGKYPNYFCQQEECPYRHKTINKTLIEGDFAVLLKEARARKEIIGLGRAIAIDLWNTKVKNLQERNKEIINEIDAVNRSINTFVDRIGETARKSVIKAYEGKVEELEAKKALLEERRGRTDIVNYDFETALNSVLDFVKNPSKRWESPLMSDKRLVLKLVFVRPLTYEKGRGYGTTDFSLPFVLFRQKVADKSQVVDMVGIEPTCRVTLNNHLRV